MASPVYERKSSVGSGSVSNLATQRRYSRVYDQPILQQTSKGPMVRVESDDTHSETSVGLTSDEHGGKMLNPEAYTFGNVMARLGLVTLILLGLITSVVGKAFLMALSQLFGFMFMFMVTFVVCAGIYLWWGAWNGDTVQLSVKKVFTLYVICCSSDFLARVLASFPVADSFPIVGSSFIFLPIILFVTFSLFAHKDGLNAMFSQETSLFVGLTLLLNLSSTFLFGEVIPSILLPQLVYGGSLLGLSLSLTAHRFPQLSLSAISRALNQRRSSYRNSLAPPAGRKMSKASMGSMPSTAPGSRSRTSLSSVSSLLSLNPQLTGVDSEVINEAHGLISDLLLLKESLNDNTRQKLRKIRELLAPKVDKTVAFGRHKVVFGDDISDEHDYENDVLYTPSDYGPSDISYAPSDISGFSSGGNSSTQLNRLTPSSRKNRSTSVVLRRSSSRFSTTTTASGMPVLDNEPINRHRSIALRDVRARISVQEKRNSVHKLGRDRIGSHDGRYGSLETKRKPQYLSPLTRTRSPGMSPKISDSDISVASVGSVASSGRTTLPAVDEKDSSAAVTADKESANRQPVATPPGSPHLSVKASRAMSQDLGDIEESEELDWVPRPRSHTEPVVKLSPLSGQLEHKEEASEEKALAEENKEVVKIQEPPTEDKQVTRFNQRPKNGYIMFGEYKQPDMSYDLAVYAESLHNELGVFENVGSWDFPIFELEDKAGDHILSHMAYVVFHEAGLMETFQIPQREFINFFRVLEANYGSNVYHNKTHAADVLHAVSYLLFEMIPEFSHEFSDDTQREWKGYSRKGTGGNIASAFSILEVFACFMAAAMHDFDHPGRTNAFLVATQSPLAVLYNDRSVLENHHAATSWDLLTQVPSNNFLSSLDAAERKRFRFLVIEAILATDLKMHFDILSEFKAKVNPDEGGGIEWHSEVDRLLVMKMIIKMADINTPTKSFDLHRSWTKRITEEFYQQSDEETSMGLPGTIFMDRSHPEKLPAIQLSFIQHLVSPLFQGCAEAGIIPGILVPADARDSLTTFSAGALTEGGMGESESKTSVGVEDDLDIGDDAFALDKKEEKVSSHKFMSLILTNLHINYEGWRSELPKEEEEEKKAIEDGKEEGDENKDAEGEDSEEKQEEGKDDDPTVESQEGVVTVIVPTVTVEEDSS